MESKIDSIFEEKYYRYIPYNLRNEWKTTYNLYGKNFYKNMHLKNNLFPVYRIDYYNEELFRLNNLSKLCNKFKENIKNIKYKYESDKEYSEKLQKSILNSLDKIDKFVKVNKNLLNKKININKIPIKRKNIEHFDNNKCNDLDKLSNRKLTIIISLVIIILFFYISFNE